MGALLEIFFPPPELVQSAVENVCVLRLLLSPKDLVIPGGES